MNKCVYNNGLWRVMFDGEHYDVVDREGWVFNSGGFGSYIKESDAIEWAKHLYDSGIRWATSSYISIKGGD